MSDAKLAFHDTSFNQILLDTIFPDGVRGEWRLVHLCDPHGRSLLGRICWSKTGMIELEFICVDKPKLFGFSVQRSFLAHRYYDPMDPDDHVITWSKARKLEPIRCVEHPFKDRPQYYERILFHKP